MLECMISLALLLISVLSDDPLWAVSAGLFAVACSLDQIKQLLKK